MSRGLTAPLYLVAGIALGIVFFGGLWLTVRALPSTRYPALIAVGSFWARTVVVGVAFAYLFSRGWENALIAVLGFLGARLLMSRWLPHRITARPSVE